MLKFFTATILCTLLMVNCFAQKICSEATINLSNQEANKKHYTQAVKDLEYSLKKYPNCVETYDRLAEWYYRTNQNNKANRAILKCITLDENKGIAAALQLKRVMQAYKEDASALELFTEIKNEATLNLENKKIVSDNINAIQLKMQILANTISTEPINLGNNINTKYNQTFPSLTLDGTSLIYTSFASELNEDFMIAKWDTCNGWNKSENLGNPPNTSNPERSVRISADGYYLFFTRCDTRSTNGWDGGGCDIFYCYKIDDSTWSNPQKFGATINSPDYEGDPCLSSDNKTLYFVSDRKGGYGGKDIWMSKFEEGLWQTPVNLGSQINTAGNETAPFIHPDDETFYFISDGQIGIGGSDCFVSNRKGDTTFTKPFNLGSPINSEFNENSICISADGKTGYISKQNKKNNFDYDIYKFNTYKAIQPKETHCIKGVVYNKYNHEAFKNFRIHIYDSAMNLIKTINSNKGDASFSFPMLRNTLSYLKVADIDEYKDFNTTIDLRKKILPANIIIPIPLKMIGFIDTLYQFNYTQTTNNEDSILKFYKKNYPAWYEFENKKNIKPTDTSLCFIKNNYAKWVNYPDDSVAIYFHIKQNIYLDTNFVNTVCFSDSGYQDYQKYNDSILQSENKKMETYFAWYKKYLIWVGFKEEQINLDIEKVIWNDEKKYTLELNVVEFY